MRYFHPAVITTAVFACVCLNSQATLIVDERDTTITISPFNLGYSGGYVGGDPGATIVNNSVVSDSADLDVNGGLFYGPDSSDQINSGTFSAVQDLQLSTYSVGADLISGSSVAGPASPISRVRNQIDIFFSSTTTRGATLSVSFLGDATNVGADDSVRLFVDRVDAAGNTPVSGGQVFSLGSHVFFNGLNASGDSFTTTFTADAGQRYRIRAEGNADSVISGSENSSLSVAVTIPEPRTITLAALSLALLLQHRRRKFRKLHA